MVSSLEQQVLQAAQQRVALDALHGEQITHAQLAVLIEALLAALRGVSSDVHGMLVELPEVELIPGPTSFNNVLAAYTGTYTSRSLTIAVGGTSQQLAAANTSRQSLWVHNPTTATEAIGVNPFGGAALIGGTDTITIPAGGLLKFETPNPVTTAQVNVVAATGGHQIVAGEM